jgi:hypothetical protein
MKIIGRTLIILALALVVSGATYALAGSRSAGGFDGFPRRGEFQPGGAPGGFQPGGFPQRGEFGRGGERDRGFSLFGAGELLKSLLIIGAVVAVGAPAAGLLRRRQPSRARAAQAREAAPSEV